MKTQLFPTLALAAGLSLVAGATLAQTRGAPPEPTPAANLGYSASPLNGQGYADRSRGDLTVMGMTGGAESRDFEATGSITRLPPGAWSVRAR